MGRFSATQTSIFGVFNKPEWKATGIATYPSNFVSADDKEYIRVSVVPSGGSLNRKSITGVVLVDIFSTAGEGPKAFYRIADSLDEFLLEKSVQSGGVTQFGRSSLGEVIGDSASSSLARVRYSIPFNHFGVL